MITREWLKKIRCIEIRTLRLVENLMAGQYHSVFKGRGMDFDEVRPYEPGDDVRRIDWNVTARTGVTHIKKFVEEREMTVILLVDASASGRAGSVNLSKRELAAEIAAVLAFSAIANNDKVGLLLFTDKTERYIRPGKGRAHVLGIISLILTYEPKHPRTDIAGALTYLGHAISRRATVFLLSDFMGPDYERALKIMARKHDLIAVPISDPIERELPSAGWVAFEDAETGQWMELNTGDAETRRLFAANAREQTSRLRRQFQVAGIDSIEAQTDRPYLVSLMKFFQTRFHRLHP
jgi:uncharacterized protein (DUF58 family)